jgi:alkanesulfonate monooxygenase SsuD/methylene tetrahydromethanopterin reductase-like flavin-dependent oxidoreductase (luciferase family)
MLDQVLSCSAIGGPAKVKAAVDGFIAETGADELIVTCQMYDHQARLRSYEILTGLMTAKSPLPVGERVG